MAAALFTKLDVEGYTKMRYQLTPDAVDLGLGAALPAQLSGLYRRTGCVNAAQAAYWLAAGERGRPPVRTAPDE